MSFSNVDEIKLQHEVPALPLSVASPGAPPAFQSSENCLFYHEFET